MKLYEIAENYRVLMDMAEDPEVDEQALKDTADSIKEDFHDKADGIAKIIRTMTGENPLLKGFGQVCGYKLNGLKDRDIPFLRRKIGVVFQDFQMLTSKLRKRTKVRYSLRALRVHTRLAIMLTLILVFTSGDFVPGIAAAIAEDEPTVSTTEQPDTVLPSSDEDKTVLTEDPAPTEQEEQEQPASDETEQEIAEEACRNSGFSEGAVIGVTTEIQDILKHRLAEGQTVVLDGIGRFSLRVESIGVDDPKDFNIRRHITRFVCGFLPAGRRIIGRHILYDVCDGVKAVWQNGFKP